MATFISKPTPNPNSMKISTDAGPFLESGMVSASAPSEVDDGSIAHRLLSISGVEDVFIVPDFVTVSKSPGAEWELLMPKIEKTLDDAFAER